MTLVDTHVHFRFEDFDEDREEALQRAREAGVGIFVEVGTDVERSRRALEFAESHENVYATAGIHPHDAKDATDKCFEEIIEMLAHPRIVGIGEIGLDFFRNHSLQEDQERVLLRFFDIYKQVGKPMIFHCRDAYDRLYEMLCEYFDGPIKGLMHCYASDKENMQKFLDLGLSISFAGPLTYKKNDLLREACEACPIDRIVVETDSPYLSPQSRRGRRNESANIVETAQKAADLHQLSLEAFAEASTQNAKNLFNICE